MSISEHDITSKCGCHNIMMSGHSVIPRIPIISVPIKTIGTDHTAVLQTAKKKKEAKRKNPQTCMYRSIPPVCHYWNWRCAYAATNVLRKLYTRTTIALFTIEQFIDWK